MEVLIYTQRLTPRVDYAIRFIFEEILGVRVRITSSYSEAKVHAGVLISYCRSKVKEGIHIVPHNLMIEDSIMRQKIDFCEWKGLPAFFRTSKEADIPFDLFATTFYLISRYEEYLLFDPDKHNRFTSEQSIAFQGGFLEEPIVDQWAYKLVDTIREKYPSFDINPRGFEFIPTFDIDNSFAYQNKGLTRAILGSLKSFFTFRFNDFANRIAVYLKMKKDPFDIYESVFSILDEWPNTIWFVLAGKYGRYDKNVSIHKLEMQNLLKSIRKKFVVGIHPSYHSGMNTERIRAEIIDIAKVLGKEVLHSRQHYLRIFLPTTYNNLVSLGVKEDYSMGYSDHSGFRAGTCTPFYFYNLKEEKVIDLKVVPFQTMDFTLWSQMKLSPLLAYDHLMSLVNKVKAVNGTFVSIWHNEYLSGQSPWKGWELLLPLVLEKVKKFRREDRVYST
jgi:hypothetical protein